MRGAKVLAYGASIYASWSQLAGAIDLDVTSDASIKSAAATAAYGMMSYYTGNHTGDNPGNLPDPYYWWEAGAMFGAMVEYWYYTGDTSYNDVVQQALLWQAGDNYDFMPENQTKTEGNDDQGFWGMAAMSAAEMKFQDPPPSKPGWLAMVQGVFNTMVPRWDASTCGGGLRWQIFTFNNGYNYKNTVANGCFFNIAARLARYTNNGTYSDWAEKTWDWVQNVGLMSSNYEVFDGTSDTDNCSNVDHLRFTYNQGLYLFGAAMMYNHTNGDQKWLTRVNGLLDATDVFFKNNIMYESACEDVNGAKGTCNVDQQSFKAYLSRWMAGTAQLVPSAHDRIMGLLTPSAKAAAQQCDGGSNQVTCGAHWTAGTTYDGTYGVGQQMSALSIMQAMLIDHSPPLVTNNTGGTSKGNPNAGGAAPKSDGNKDKPATGGDKAGAAILTALVLAGLLGGVGFMVFGE